MATDPDHRPSVAEPPAPLPATAPHPLSGVAAWLPWVLLAAAVALGLFLLDRGQPGPATSAPASARATTAASRATVTDEAADSHPRLQIAVRRGVADVNGTLAEADRARMDAALAKIFGAGAVHGDIQGDTATPAADWLDGLLALLPELKARDVRIAVDGGRMKADLSAVPAGARATLSDKMRDAFAGFDIAGLGPPSAAPANTGNSASQARPGG